MEQFDSFHRNPENVEGSNTGKYPRLMLGYRPLEIKGYVVSFLLVCPLFFPFSHLCTSSPRLFLYGFQPSQAALGTDICNHCSMVHKVCSKFISSHISCKCSWCRMNTLDGSEANKWDAKLAYNKPLSWSTCGSPFYLKPWGKLEASSGTWQSTSFQDVWVSSSGLFLPWKEWWMMQNPDPCLGPPSTEDAASIWEARACAVTHNEEESWDSDTRVNIFTLKPVNGQTRAWVPSNPYFFLSRQMAQSHAVHSIWFLLPALALSTLWFVLVLLAFNKFVMQIFTELERFWVTVVQSLSFHFSLTVGSWPGSGLLHSRLVARHRAIWKH